MSAEDIQNLMGHLINYKQVLGNQANSQQGHAITEAQNLIENYYKDLKERRDAQAAEDAKKVLKHSDEYKSDGKVKRTYFDYLGNPVRTEELGEIPANSQAAKLLRMPDGTVQTIDPQVGQTFPAGTSILGTSEGSGGLTEAQKFSQAGKLAEIDAKLVANEVDNPEELEGYAELYNREHPTHQWIKVPGTGGLFGSDAKWTKLPKNAAEIVKMPPDTLVGRSPSGKKITLEMIVAKAQELGVSPEQALKELGLAR